MIGKIAIFLVGYVVGGLATALFYEDLEKEERKLQRKVKADSDLRQSLKGRESILRYQDESANRRASTTPSRIPDLFSMEREQRGIDQEAPGY